MNHAQNTPGYGYRLQVAFTLRDGTPRAWILGELDGKAVGIASSFETAKNWVEKDLADELPVGTFTNAQAYGRQVALTSIPLEQAFPGKKPCCSGCAAGKPCEGGACSDHARAGGAVDVA